MKSNKDALLGKISNIRNCLKSIKTTTNLDPASLDNQLIQDAYVLNLERSIQACIDITNLIIAERGFELPRSYRHGMEILQTNGVINEALAIQMKNMCGFRNIAIHDYMKIEIAILKSILVKNLSDIEDFTTAIHMTIK